MKHLTVLNYLCHNSDRVAVYCARLYFVLRILFRLFFFFFHLKKKSAALHESIIKRSFFSFCSILFFTFFFHTFDAKSISNFILFCCLLSLRGRRNFIFLYFFFPPSIFIHNDLNASITAF